MLLVWTSQLNCAGCIPTTSYLNGPFPPDPCPPPTPPGIVVREPPPSPRPRLMFSLRDHLPEALAPDPWECQKKSSHLRDDFIWS